MDALRRAAGSTAHRALLGESGDGTARAGPETPVAIFFRQLIVSKQSFIGSEGIEGPGRQTRLAKVRWDRIQNFVSEGRF
jgi:hypothetical protein